MYIKICKWFFANFVNICACFSDRDSITPTLVTTGEEVFYPVYGFCWQVTKLFSLQKRLISGRLEPVFYKYIHGKLFIILCDKWLFYPPRILRVDTMDNKLMHIPNYNI